MGNTWVLGAWVRNGRWCVPGEAVGERVLEAGREDVGDSREQGEGAPFPCWGRSRGAVWLPDQVEPASPVELEQVVDRALEAPLVAGGLFAA